MIVRRLKALGRRIAASIARMFGQRVVPHRAEVAAGAAHNGAATSPRFAARHITVGTNWLEDARRLRGRPAPHALPPHPATAALRQVLRDPHWISAFEAGRLAFPQRPSRPLDDRAPRDPARDPNPGSSHETLRASPHRPPAPSGSAPAPDAPDAAAARHDAEAQRRLLLIRELVRRGLYNEGFKPGHIPDQYRPRLTPPGASTTEPPQD